MLLCFRALLCFVLLSYRVSLACCRSRRSRSSLAFRLCMASRPEAFLSAHLRPAAQAPVLSHLLAPPLALPQHALHVSNLRPRKRNLPSNVSANLQRFSATSLCP
ncbi:hypothetical protein DFH09DRAFT_1119655 [Mycena vulgaris]|nr:hypothetical protein DFH09DRAFT_1119655 [Mycena vulgaris]